MKEIIKNQVDPILRKGHDEFEKVEFLNCVFTDLSHLSFTDCKFSTCNLSNAKLQSARLQHVEFAECKLMGVNFSPVRDFGFMLSFDNCNLAYTSFDKKKLNKSIFKNCHMNGANFTEADLSKCIFENCDLQEVLFLNSNLSGVDFTSCSNFLIDPELNNIKKAKFMMHDLYRLLYRHGIEVV